MPRRNLTGRVISRSGDKTIVVKGREESLTHFMERLFVDQKIPCS